MAFCEKREKYAQATIDLSDGTLTEFYPDGTKTFNIDDILKRWDGVPNITLTIERRTELSPVEERCNYS